MIEMIIDVTGIELTPGNCGVNCLGNGEHLDKEGNVMECCCDECSYLMCCLPEHCKDKCENCTYTECPNNISLLER